MNKIILALRWKYALIIPLAIGAHLQYYWLSSISTVLMIGIYIFAYNKFKCPSCGAKILHQRYKYDIYLPMSEYSRLIWGAKTIICSFCQYKTDLNKGK